MISHNRIVPPLLCIVLLAVAGCAKPRTGPFDVSAASPHGAPETGHSSAVGDDAGGVKGAAAVIESLKIYFAFNRSNLTAEAQQTLERVGALLKQNPSIRIGIRGHCDERGSRNYNFDLGEHRARAAYGYLVKNGVSRDQLAMVTYGEAAPAASGRSEPAYARNRRSEFIVLTTCR